MKVNASAFLFFLHTPVSRPLLHIGWLNASVLPSIQLSTFAISHADFDTKKNGKRNILIFLGSNTQGCSLMQMRTAWRNSWGKETLQKQIENGNFGKKNMLF